MNRCLGVGLLAVGALLVQPPVQAQSTSASSVTKSTARTYSPPRTPWGHPDLQGIYSNDDETGTPMERPRQLEGRTLADITPEELRKIVEYACHEGNHAMRNILSAQRVAEARVK